MRANPALASAQCAHGVLLVRPARFGHNSQTAPSNPFQQPATLPDTAARARSEFDSLCGGLEAAGVRVCVVDDTAEPAKPDAVFPNNWVSFHRDGTVVLYPMQASNRRAERRTEVLAAVEMGLGFHRRRLIDLRDHEQHGRMLEGTGSLVLDHVQRVAYACRSARTDESVVREWSKLINYDPVLFDAQGGDGVPVYHTNVLLSIGARWAVVCADAIVEHDRARVLQRLRDSGRDVVAISAQAMADFAANILELRGRDPHGGAHSVLALSQRARAALQGLHPAWDTLRGCVDTVVAAAVPTIEAVGGGSVRCMLAEVPET
ncbi:MAG: citrulline utilization hydrolase CtlX [Steroidobacterales bacterium]